MLCGLARRLYDAVASTAHRSLLGVQSALARRDSLGLITSIPVVQICLTTSLLRCVVRLAGRLAAVETGRQELSHVLGAGRAGQEALWEVLGNGAAMIQELVRHDLIEVGPLLGVAVEDARDQVAGRVADIDVVGERVVVLFDTPVRRFHIGRLERRLADDQCVNDDTQRPYIDFIRVA